MSFQLPEKNYLTLPETAKVLGCSIEDLFYYIENRLLEVRLYTPPNRMMIVSKSGARETTGHAACDYHGLLELEDFDSILMLLQGSRLIGDTAVRFRICEPYKMTRWLDNGAQENNVSRPVYQKWRSVERHNYSDDMLAVFMPYQQCDDYDRFSELKQHAVESKGMSPDEAEAAIYRMPNSPARYIANTRAAFTLDNLRVLKPASGILPGNSPASFCHAAEQKEPLPWCASKTKITAINEVLERLYQAQRLLSANALWKELKLNSSAYDSDNYIDDITSGEIYWFTRKDKQRVMKSKTFDNRISEIRTYYKTNNL